MSRRLNIFVHRASQFLTDHGSHGDGLICFSLLNGLAERGHNIFAFADHAEVASAHPRLIVRAQRHRIPANSLGPFEQSFRAERWFRQLRRQGVEFDLVWRMHPYDDACPYRPYTAGLPLVVGPLFYAWPEHMVPDAVRAAGRARFGIGISRLIKPLLATGWRQTLNAASLVLCSTDNHAAAIRASGVNASIAAIPVIVDPPVNCTHARSATPNVLSFVGNLVANKRPGMFVELIRSLRLMGHNVSGVMMGDGPEAGRIRSEIEAHSLSEHIRMVGRLPNQQVFKAVGESHLLISCSIGEPYGRSIVEAMAVGTPAVCHASGGPADIIVDGINGHLVSDPTADAYARTVGAILNDSGRWARMSDAAKVSAAAWRSEVVLGQLEDLLADATGVRRSACAAYNRIALG